VTTTTVRYQWVKHLLPQIAELTTIPLVGYPPPFPWKDLEAELARFFELDQLQLQASVAEWRTEETHHLGLGRNIKVLTGDLGPLSGGWTWAMGEDELNKLISLLLTKKTALAGLDAHFEEGITQFIALEVINAFTHLNLDKELSPRLSDGAPLAGPAFSLDINVKIAGHSVSGRLLLSQELHHSLQERYAKKSSSEPISTELAQRAMATIHLEAAKTTLSYAEWAKVSVGDMILLDKFSSRGRVMLTVNGQPLFRGRMKEGTVKLLESPLYYEVEDTMAKNGAPEGRSESEAEEEPDLETEGFDEELPEEEISDERGANTSVAQAPPSQAENEEDASQQPGKAKEPLTSPTDLPLTVVVEVGRLNMSIQKLLELQPGNILEVDASPESGVDLVVNSRLVGRGELVLIGETLGVRVLDLAGK
jgi:flagellar motor switch protein FliN